MRRSDVIAIVLGVVALVFIILGSATTHYISWFKKPAQPTQEPLVYSYIGFGKTLPQLNITVINQLRESLHEQPLAWSYGLAAFAFYRSLTVVHYWESTGVFMHAYLQQNITQWFSPSSAVVYEDLLAVPQNGGVLTVVPSYTLRYGNTTVVVNITQAGNSLVISVNGTKIVISTSTSQLLGNLTNDLLLFLIDPGHAYPLLDPSAKSIGAYATTYALPYTSCTWMQTYEEAYCTGNQQTNWYVIAVEVSNETIG